MKYIVFDASRRSCADPMRQVVLAKCLLAAGRSGLRRKFGQHGMSPMIRWVQLLIGYDQVVTVPSGVVTLTLSKPPVTAETFVG